MYISERNSFLEYIKNHVDEELLIIYPRQDQEDYILNLESEILNKYGVDIHKSNISYLCFSQQCQPCILNKQIIVDPSCYVYVKTCLMSACIELEKLKCQLKIL